VAGSAVRRHILEVGAECVSSACSDLCGGWSAMTIPTAIKPRSGCRRCFECGRQHEQARHRERLVDPAWSKNLACADALCAGTGRSRDRPLGNRRRSASGRRGAVADDARSREVRLCHSSWEADEQSRATGRGAGGAKGGGQGECEPAKHAPDSEPGKRVTRAGAHTAKRKKEKKASPSNTRGGSRVPELGPLGSVRGALSNERPYRDLRNGGENYPFERSHRFAVIEPNSGRGDYSRSSCEGGRRSSGLVSPAFYAGNQRHSCRARRAHAGPARIPDSP